MLENSKIKGNAGVGIAISYFTLNAYVVSIPLTDTQEYDLIIDDGSSLKRVQVKYTSYTGRNKIFQVDLRTRGRKYIKVFSKLAVDFLFVVTEDLDTYLIPVDSIKSKSSISLSMYEEFRVGQK